MEIIITFAILATIAGSAMALSNVFQAVKIFSRKSAFDISKFMYIVLTIGTFIWLLYGIEIKNFPIVISNGIGFIINIIILIGFTLY